MTGEGIGESKMEELYQNAVDEETKEADSKDEVAHNGRSDQLFLEKMKVAEQE